MPTNYANIFRQSPPAETVVSKVSVLRELEKLINQVDAIAAALQRHQRRIDDYMIEEQAEIDFAARFNAIIVSKKMPGWKAQFATLTRALKICDTYRVKIQQIEKTVKDKKKWIGDEDTSVDMVDLNVRRKTALQERELFILTIKDLEDVCGLSFIVSGEDETERDKFIVYD